MMRITTLLLSFLSFSRRTFLNVRKKEKERTFSDHSTETTVHHPVNLTCVKAIDLIT